VYGDDAVAEWRVRQITQARGPDGAKTMAVVGWGIKHDLAMNTALIQFDLPTTTGGPSPPAMHHELLGLTIAQHLEHIDDWWPGYFSAGTVSTHYAARRYDLAYSWETPFSALNELATVAHAEWDVQRTSTGYKINVSTALNSTQPTVEVAYGKSQLAARRGEDSAEQTTRVYVKGGGDAGYEASLADVWWRTQAGASSTKWQVPNLRTIETDQLAGKYIHTFTGVKQQIAGSFSTTDIAGYSRTALTFSSALTSLEWFQISDSTAGAPIMYVDSPSAEATYGIRPMVLERPDLTGINNWNVDGFMGSAAANDWTTVGTPTVTLTTGPSPFIKYGPNALRVVSTAINHGIETQHIAQTAGDSPPLSSGWPHVTVQAELYVVSGKVKLQLLDMTNTVTYPGTTSQVARTESVGTRHHIVVAPGGVNFYDEGTTGFFKIRLLADSSAAEWYTDAVQVVRTPAPAPQVVWSSSDNVTDQPRNAQALWDAATYTLETHLEPEDSFDVDALDFYRIDSDTFTGEQLVLGGSVRLLDAGIGLDSTRRIYSIRRDLKVVGNTRITLEP
jgi:hypothetical protein